MTDAKLLSLANDVYKSLCDAIDSIGWTFDRTDEKLMINFAVRGDDIPMHFRIFVDAERQLVRLISLVPFDVAADKINDLALATCHANYLLREGSFDFDIKDGHILYRLCTCYIESLISKEMLEHMVHVACASVDHYNDKFLMISKGLLSVDDFVKAY